MNELVTTIQSVLGEADLVLGWKTSERTGAAMPARFHSAQEAEAAIFDSTCVHNLAVYLPKLKGKKIGIVAKACDSRSIVQLITEGEVDRGQVTIIGVTCASGMLDVKSIRRRFGYDSRIDDGDSPAVAGEQLDLDAYLSIKCRMCSQKEPLVHDELISAPETGRNVGGAQGSSVETQTEADAATGNAPATTLAAEFAAMSPPERRKFWQEQFSRCIRCYACREACPMCFCRDVCTMQSTDPRWVGGEVNAASAEMAQLIRVNHLAGRCTSCGECQRACPVGIPLMLLLGEQNRAIEEMFDYRAGTDPDARPPLLTFDIKNDNWGGG